jgi:hypothetical protein
MKWLISAARSQVFYGVAAAFAFTGLLELFFGRTIKSVPTWAFVLMLIGGTAGIVISLLADRAARKAKPD